MVTPRPAQPPPKPRGGRRALAGREEQVLRLAGRDHTHAPLGKKVQPKVRNGVARMSPGWIISGSAEILRCPRCANDRAPARETWLRKLGPSCAFPSPQLRRE